MIIKTWRERVTRNVPLGLELVAMEEEIAELRAEIERLTGSELGLNRYLATVQAESKTLCFERDTALAELEVIKQQEPFCYVYTENGDEYFTPQDGYKPDDAKPLYLQAGAKP